MSLDLVTLWTGPVLFDTVGARIPNAFGIRKVDGDRFLNRNFFEIIAISLGRFETKFIFLCK